MHYNSPFIQYTREVTTTRVGTSNTSTTSTTRRMTSRRDASQVWRTVRKCLKRLNCRQSRQPSYPNTNDSNSNDSSSTPPSTSNQRIKFRRRGSRQYRSSPNSSPGSGERKQSSDNEGHDEVEYVTSATTNSATTLIPPTSISNYGRSDNDGDTRDSSKSNTSTRSNTATTTPTTNNSMSIALQQERQTIMEAIQNKRYSGWSLQHASTELQNDKEIVLAAVSLCGGSLIYASTEMKADREVVLAAVQSYGRALCHASMELRSNDLEIVLTAVSRDETALSFVGKELWADAVACIMRNEGYRRLFEDCTLDFENEYGRYYYSEDAYYDSDTDESYHLSSES